ncbi:MAG: ATP-binding protein, partial [Eubacteriales bacterium]|nr:ATP-binding protein [Eubacteriales bacterium]
MKNDLLKKIEETILRHNMTAGHDDSILAAVSGGPDSVCMLHALAELSGRQDPGFRLAAVHVDHMLRGTESDRDREFTAEICAKLGVKLFIERRSASLKAEQSKLCLEEAAREMRYEIFYKIAADCGFNRIATAH